MYLRTSFLMGNTSPQLLFLQAVTVAPHHRHQGCNLIPNSSARVERHSVSEDSSILFYLLRENI